MLAELMFRDTTFTRAVALNGTPLPLDEKFGIGLRRFQATAAGLMKRGDMNEFEERAYGDFYERFKGRISPREFWGNIRELALMEHYANGMNEPVIHWDKAIVGRFDVIFPTRNMYDYWGERAELLPLPHYPFADAELILREIEHR